MKYALAFILFFLTGNYSFEPNDETNHVGQEDRIDNVSQIEHKLEKFNQRIMNINQTINEKVFSDNR